MPQEIKEYRAKVGELEIIFETGHYAEQAGGAATLRMGDSMLFVTATMSAKPREGIDFFPLSVDFEERMYAVGRIPGGYFRREGRPGERCILTARVTDRPLRPLFPRDMRNEVQVIVTPWSHDQEHDVDMLSIIGASTALTISDIPWDGPLGAVRIGLVNDKLIVNPTVSQMAKSTLNLRVAASSDAIVMVECGAQEVPENILIEALDLAWKSVQGIIELQKQMAAEIGKPKRAYEVPAVNQALKDEVDAKVTGNIQEILKSKFDKDLRNEALDELRENVVAEYESLEDVEIDLKEVREAISERLKSEIRRRIVEEGLRPDGRGMTDIRDLYAEIDLLPRAHGSGMFKRGQTQVLSIATLGNPRDSQELDDIFPGDEKRYMHHYNFPPFSTGETWFLRGPKRREIGHGALAENALVPVLPPEDKFAYTLRVVSEVLSSNGSTSMASVCASTLSLMAAGVPIKAPVAGIAMGLIKEDDKTFVLTDIQGLEDHIGDMDFKVAGTEKGVTALQMDIKIKGVTQQTMEQALAQARDARLQILKVMTTTIPEPRPELSEYAPRLEILKIKVDKIGAVIGPGGKTIRAIQEETGTKIEILEDGTVYVTGPNGPETDRACETIMNLVEEAEPGRIYTGKVVRIESYGAFVEFLPGQDGMLHISQLSTERVERVEDEISLGDEIMVMVVDMEPDGKVRLSRKAVLEGWSLEEARNRDRARSGSSRGGRSGGGRSGGGDRRGGGRGGRSGGGDRRGGSSDKRGGGGYKRDNEGDRRSRRP